MLYMNYKQNSLRTLTVCEISDTRNTGVQTEASCVFARVCVCVCVCVIDKYQ